MKKHYYFICAFFVLQLLGEAFAQSGAPVIMWQKTIGGTGNDVLTAICTRSDKSVLLCGYSNSGISGNKSGASFGTYDYWLVKLDSSGNILWNKTYGGNDEDFASAVINTADGGYVVGGSSVSNKSGSKTFKSYQNSFDYWVLKLDANGNKVWDRTLGGTYAERLTGLAELPNGSLVVGGSACSNGNGTKTTRNKGSETNADYWTVLLNSDGNDKSQQLFGGEGHDVMTAVSAAGANSFYAAGYSYSKVGSTKTLKSFGNNDYYIIRYNATTRKTEYEGDLGGKLSDYLTCMQALPDSSFVLGGYSNSPKSYSKTGPFFGATDFWMLKLNRKGTVQWDKVIAGGSGSDYLISVQQTKDKGFILGGYSNSDIGNSKTENAKGGYDYWIVKLDSLGNKQWDKTIGGSKDDKLTAIYELDSNQYIVAGTSASGISGDKTADVIGTNTTDYWVLRLNVPSAPRSRLAVNNTAAQTATGNYKLDIMPNPVKESMTIRYNTAASSKASFVVYDAGGKVVLQAALTASSTGATHTFNVAKLPAGSYFAVLYVDGMQLTKTFTKE